jgi:hypothetical protein
LGGSLYREVLLQPGSGSLIQALGMSSSQMLRPTVQRFVIDESCVFLLCSDGLSDSDRVEQFWPSVVRPLLTADKSTAKVGKQLVDLANKFNGHDNVTVGLLTAHVVRESDRMVPRDLDKDLTSAAASQPASAADSSGTTQRSARGTTQLTQPQQSSNGLSVEQATTAIGHATGPKDSHAAATTQRLSSASTNSPQKIAAVLALLTALGGALYFLLGGFGAQLTASNDGEGNPVNSTPDAVSPATSTGVRPGASRLATIEVGAYVRIRQSDIPGIVSSAPNQANREPTADPTADPTAAEDAQVLRLYPKPTRAQRFIPGSLPAGSIVQITEQASAEQTQWVRLKLCSIPSGMSVPAETDSPETNSPEAGSPRANSDSKPSNVNASEAEPVGTEPIILKPGSEGWAVEGNVAAVADNVKTTLQPTQLGNCER